MIEIHYVHVQNEAIIMYNQDMLIKHLKGNPRLEVLELERVEMPSEVSVALEIMNDSCRNHSGQ